MFNAITYIYESENAIYIANETKPLQLYVTINSATILKEDIPKHYREISIRGLRNPLPFTKIILEDGAISLDKWLYNTPYKYKKVGEVRHSK